MMKATKLFLYSSVAIFASIAVLTSCAGVAGSRMIASPKPDIRKPMPVAQVNQTRPVNPKFVEAKTRFGFKLFSEILKEDSQKNVFVSPSSVAIALSMTYNGAGGETKQAMAKALELQGMSLEEINQSNANLKQALQAADPKVQLSIANSLWASQKLTFNPEFIRRNQKFYDAKIETLDFTSSSAPQQINAWVKENTRGKISQIVDKIDPSQAMFLLNAIYFKGNWTEQFDKSQTQERPFYLADGTQKRHPLMKQSGKYNYLETNQFQAVSLPYGNERLSFYVFLPKSKSGLSDFQKSLNAKNWQTWMNQFRNRQGSIQIPRFKMSYDVKLNEALSTLGMGIAFENRANFSGLSNTSTMIDEVKHKTFVEVNEEGTEAAAVTSVGIMPTSIQIEQEPFNLVVDRPFFCAIRDNQTGEILFMGSIVNPEQ